MQPHAACAVVTRASHVAGGGRAQQKKEVVSYVMCGMCVHGCCRSEAGKWKAVVQEIRRMHKSGRPVLVRGRKGAHAPGWA